MKNFTIMQRIWQGVSHRTNAGYILNSGIESDKILLILNSSAERSFSLNPAIDGSNPLTVSCFFYLLNGEGGIPPAGVLRKAESPTGVLGDLGDLLGEPPSRGNRETVFKTAAFNRFITFFRKVLDILFWFYGEGGILPINRDPCWENPRSEAIGKRFSRPPHSTAL